MRKTGFSSRFRSWSPILVCSLLQACLTSGREGAPDGGGRGAAHLVLMPAALVRSEGGAAPVPDSARIRVSGEGMAPMDFSFSGNALALDLDGLPEGGDRSLDAYLFRAGRLLYFGRGTFSFRREVRTEAVLRCEPQFSRVICRFHLPTGIPVPIRSGLLGLSGAAGRYSSPLLVRGEFASFLIDELPGDARYDVSMSLSDSAGTVRYQAERSGMYLPLGEEAKWDLALVPGAAAAGVALSLVAPKEATVEAGFPSRKRGPDRFGDAIVSEFYAAPAEKDSASQGEWFELFNRTADTLALGGCRLARDRSGGITRSYAFGAAGFLAPGEALAFGRSASPAAVRYADFTLVNTASSLLLLCRGDSLLVDSLRYSSAAADSGTALPMREGWVTGLDKYAMGRRDAPGSWCLEKPGAAMPGEAPVASPGGTGECE